MITWYGENSWNVEYTRLSRDSNNDSILKIGFSRISLYRKIGERWKTFKGMEKESKQVLKENHGRDKTTFKRWNTKRLKRIYCE